VMRRDLIRDDSRDHQRRAQKTRRAHAVLGARCAVAEIGEKDEIDGIRSGIKSRLRGFSNARWTSAYLGSEQKVGSRLPDVGLMQRSTTMRRDSIFSRGAIPGL
jgi:hypothetical protein